MFTEVPAILKVLFLNSKMPWSYSPIAQPLCWPDEFSPIHSQSCQHSALLWLSLLRALQWLHSTHQLGAGHEHNDLGPVCLLNLISPRLPGRILPIYSNLAFHSPLITRYIFQIQVLFPWPPMLTFHILSTALSMRSSCIAFSS